MALDYPASPSVGQTYAGPGGIVWQWDAAKWINGAGVAAYAPIASPVFTGDPQAPTAAAGDADTSVATTAFVSAAVSTALRNVGRNLIHNPLFNVAQRGAGPFTTGVYSLDRWHINLTLDTVNVTQGPFNDTQRAQIGDEEATNALIAGIAGNAGATAFSFINQPIENVRRLGNKTVTVSLWAYATSGTPKIGIGFRQYFGTGGSPSALVTINATPITLTTTVARYSVTVPLPSIAGKTLGTNNDHFTSLDFYMSAGANTNAAAGGIGVQSNTFVFWGMQLEIGSVATPLEKPDQRYDLANCQRFFAANQFMVAGYNTAGGAIIGTVALPQMRAQPAVALSGLTYGNGSGASVYTAYPSQFAVQSGVTATGAAQAFGTYTASADL